LLLNEIARELTSILNLDDVLKRVGELLNRVLDYQMFSVLLVDPTGENCSTGSRCVSRKISSSNTMFPWAAGWLA